MARGRMITKSICTSIKVANLGSVEEKLLFTWMIPHTDDDGRLQGDPRYIRGLVFPMEDFKIADIEKWLVSIAENNLIIYYIEKDKEERYIQIVDHEKHQDIRKDRYKESVIPLYNSGTCTLVAGRQPNVNQVSTKRPRNIIEDKLIEDKLSKDTTVKPPVCPDTVYFEYLYFWYPRHTAKKNAEKAFKKLKADESKMTAIIIVLEQQIEKQYKFTDKEHIPHLATYLNQSRWEDEVLDMSEPSGRKRGKDPDDPWS